MDSAIIESDLAPPSAPPAPPTNVLAEIADYRESALRFAVRISGNVQDAEDIVQEAYVRLIRCQERLRPGPEARALLLRSVATVARDLYTSKRRRIARETKLARNREQFAKAELTHDNLSSAVERAVTALDENLRLPVCLHYEQGLSYAEAAQILNVPEGTLRVYAQRGLEILRKKLAREGFVITPAILLAVLQGAAGAAGSATSRKHPSRRPKAAAGASTRSLAGIAVALLMAGAGTVFLLQTPSSPSLSSTTPATSQNIPVSNAEVKDQTWLTIDGVVTSEGPSILAGEDRAASTPSGEQRRVRIAVLHSELENQMKIFAVERTHGEKSECKAVIVSATLYNPDGSVLIDLVRQPSYLRFPDNSGKYAMIYANVDWHGGMGVLSVFLTRLPDGKSAVTIVVDSKSNPPHTEFLHRGVLAGSANIVR